MFIEKGLFKPVLEELNRKIRKAWSVETCSPSLRSTWSEEGNPALGQCLMAALIVQDVFEGDICFLRLENGAIHYYNVIDGKIADLTADQFSVPIDKSFYAEGETADREKLMADPIKLERYNILRSRL